MRSDLFAPSHQETAASQPGMVLQNSKMLKVALAGEVLARQGSMVAYQGEVQFKALGSGGVGKFLKQKLTGEGIPLGLGTLLGRSTGEAFTMSFAGQGFVIVQPSEELPANLMSGGGGDESGSGGLLGGLMGR